jgi:hypothetical protein
MGSLTLDLPAGIPTMISLGGTALTTDGATLSLDTTQAADIELTTDKVCTWYGARLVEYTVVAGAATATPVIGTSGPSPTLSLPANVLKPNHTYALVATCQTGGFTGVDTGDLRTFQLPSATGAATSAVFTIGP